MTDALPDFETDPAGYFQAQNAQLRAELQTLRQQVAAGQHATDHGFRTRYQNQKAAFTKNFPDYDKAEREVLKNAELELKAEGFTDEQAKQHAPRYLAYYKYADASDVPSAIYEDAKRLGHKPNLGEEPSEVERIQAEVYGK